jgi:large subunit ribosomal protein L10
MEVFAWQFKAKTFYFVKRGGEFSLAFTKEHKGEIIAQYEEWLKKSKAVLIVEYNHMSMKEIDGFRAKVRDAGGQVHVAKNTLMKIAMENAGMHDQLYLEKTSLVGFAFSDAAALAKVFNEATKNSEVFKLKGGYLDGRPLKAKDVKALAELPPLPVMRARLLGVLLAPASQVVRTIAEPGRQVAAVIKAYSDKEAVPAA